EPLSWGMVHPDVISVQAMLKDAGFSVPEINMKAYMEARAMTQSFMDDFLGYFIDSKNKIMTSLLVQSGLPGGMMGSMMADLKGIHDGINRFLRESNQPELSQDDMLIKLFEEVAYVWPRLGYPPLVTPFSQYVKNVALLNVMQIIKGNKRYSMMDNNTWDMILGKAGKLPGPLAPEILELAAQQGKEFYEGLPQDNYPDELDKYRQEMQENNWETGPDDEELFELAMHTREYRDYKSGVAKKRFADELEKIKTAANAPAVAATPVAKPTPPPVSPPKIEIDPNHKVIVAPARGKLYFNFNFETNGMIFKPGDKIKKEQRICYLETSSYIEEIHSPYEGEVVKVYVKQNEGVTKEQIILTLK
ncbi:MAG: biotin/lipoyl-containing protein, partial [Bacteroidota bacterium]